ncbi:MAG: T9SS type A sorting domain-containing protein [candidate division KSB1 bacterium]|nr:T9SS type A sorting domain-containing protein [candidate division KSB1 bacterium]MDZ7303668.1 T9SS type A sorting domain-containing protein [candidate division KSB1 bacterium]MDZ7313312.1 T9SS type A sorting domain-containing protein [candidate division KSB1 bacterium]
MKRHFFLLIFLFLLVAPVRAQFGEEFRSESKRRFAKMFRGFLLGDPDQPLILGFRDMNRNGVRDRIQLAPDGQGGVNLLVYDGLSQTPMWRFPLTQTLGISEIDFIGFVNFKGDESVQAVIYSRAEGGNGGLITVVDPQTNAIEYDARANGIIAILIGLFDVDRDNKPEMLFGDGSVRQIIVVGWMGGGGGSNAGVQETPLPVSLLSVVDYQLQLKFESGPHHELAFDAEAYERASDLDLEGDGVMDLALLIENPNNDPVGLVVRDGATHDVKWQFPFPQEHLEELRRGFHGFFDVNGDGQNEALFGNHTAVTFDGVVHSLDANFQILAVTDVDNDSLPDLVGRGLPDSTVQVWGVASPTGVSEKDLIIAGFQLYQNYPNPFNPSTSISYSIAHAGEVKLTIFNTLGQAVRTLVNERKPAGEYNLSWDGRDDAGHLLSSGPYFYRLKVGEAVETRRLLFLK